MLVISFIFVLIFFYKNIISQKVNYSREYFFSIINITLFFPFLFFANNLYSFLFLLEFLSTLIFYKLVVSKINQKPLINLEKNIFFSKKYISMLFFQFWITFFSTITLFYFFNQILLMVGSSD